MVHKYLAYAGYLLVGGTAIKAAQVTLAGDKDIRAVDLADHVPTRQYQLSSLRKSSLDRPFDMLVVGGGATGAGVALDAATRGLRTALVERDDFGSGASSKSTKLVHGGVRYLEKAFWNFDLGQLKLVTEALHERRVLLDNAPHLTSALPILMPCYRWWEVPYFWAGLKAYDLVAGMKNLVLSKFVSPTESLQRFPSLAPVNPNGQTLKGTVLYYDGQFNDSRLNVALACTAAAAGATVLNHMEVSRLIKNSEGKVVGAVTRDTLTGQETQVFARVVVNATGPFADSIRRMSDSKAATVVTPSAGAHITLPSFYAPGDVGMIIPKTKDGRVCFVLPWQGHVIAGTTDTPCSVTNSPQASAEEISFILDSVSDFLSIKVRKEDVLSTWSGLRPLASDPTAHNTASISRDHVIISERDGSITVTGGKWTTYRKMAEDAVDAALATGRLPAVHECCTSSQKLIGGESYTPAFFAQLAQDHSSRTPGTASISIDTAHHLAHSYGDRSERVLALAEQAGLQRPLVKGHPVLEAEVLYCVRNEYCETVQDFIARRTRLAFVDARAAVEAVPRVAELMAAELGWSSARKRREVEGALAYLNSFLPPVLPA